MADKKILIVSGPVIIENGKVLLNKHGDDNFWKFLGGKEELFEFNNVLNSLEETCGREAKSKMGFDIKIIKPLKPMMVQKPGDPDTWVVLIHYLAERLGEIKPREDIREYEWFDINNLPQECAPNIKPVIEEYLKS